MSELQKQGTGTCAWRNGWPSAGCPASVLVEQPMAELTLNPNRVAKQVQQLKAQTSGAPAQKKNRSQATR